MPSLLELESEELNPYTHDGLLSTVRGPVFLFVVGPSLPASFCVFVAQSMHPGHFAATPSQRADLQPAYLNEDSAMQMGLALSQGKSVDFKLAERTTSASASLAPVKVLFVFFCGFFVRT